MILSNADIYAERQGFGRHIAIHMSYRNESGFYVAQPTSFSKREEGEHTEPMTSLTPHVAQSLMDELWRCGLRPTEGAGSAGSLAATERHLKDMQTIAFQLLPTVSAHKEGA